MNPTEDKSIEITKQHQLNSTASKFELTIAYRLLIGAYIRSVGKVGQIDGQIDERMKPTKQS